MIPTKLASYFYLSDDDFDYKWNFEYSGGIESRGPLPYYLPPSGFFKTGIRVEGRYDEGDDTWLLWDEKGWAGGFHGLRRDV